VLKCLVPSVVRKTHDWRHHVDSLVELFKEDLPSPLSLSSELHICSIKFTNCDQSKLPSIPLQALNQCDKEAFPNFFRPLKIAATLPMTTCEAERHVSALRRLKMCLRTTILEDCLNVLALLRIHRKVNIDLDFAVDEFARSNNPRFVLK